jgi:hypothetical protein
MPAPNFPAIQQAAINFLLGQYASEPAVAAANINTNLVALLQALGDTVVSHLTTIDDSIPILQLQLTMPVAMVLTNCYSQDAVQLASNNIVLIVASNGLGHGFQVHL